MTSRDGFLAKGKLGRNDSPELVLLRPVFGMRLLAWKAGEAADLMLLQSVLVGEGVTAAADMPPRLVLLLVLEEIALVFKGFAAFSADLLSIGDVDHAEMSGRDIKE